MSTINYLTVRNTVLPAVNATTLTVSSLNFRSTMISLGQSTNQSYTFNNGSFTTGWASTLTGLTSIKKVVLSPNGSVQTVLQNSGSTMSTTITSLNSGITWAGSTMRGLPTSGALPYQTYGSTINTMTVPSITAINAAASSGNQLAIASNELVYSSANSGATFAATGLGQNNNPFIYLPFDGSVADVMGNATVTTTGSMAYAPGKVGTQALNLSANTAGGTASNYIDLITAPLSSFTASGWFNMQTFSATQSQYIFSGNGSALSFSVSTTGVCRFASLGVSITTSFTISTNIWYQFTVVFQSAGLCSLYINGSLIGQATGTAVSTAANMRLGAISDYTIFGAFSGYIDDFRLYNYAVTNPSGAALINPLVGPIMPFVYLTFDGSTTTDMMGNSTTTATGSPGFVAGQIGSNALDLSSNTAGGTATKNISGTWAGTSNFTVSGWFNAQAIPASSVAMIFSAGTGAATAFQVFITTGGVLTVYSAAAYATSTITTNTWYFFQVVYQSSGTCYVYLNGTQATTFAGTTLSPIPTTFNIGTYTHTAAVGAFKGYIDDIRIYNGAFMPSQLSPVLYSPSHAVGSPNIYLPFENGSVLDVMGYSAVSARGTMNFVPGIIGSSALNLVNPAGGTAVNYIRGSWAGSPNSTVSFWFNAQNLGQIQVLSSAYGNSFVIYLNASNTIGMNIPSAGGVQVTATTSYTITSNTWYYVTSIFQTNGACSLYVNNSLVGTSTNSGGVSPYTTVGFSIGTYDGSIIYAFNGYIDDVKIYNCAVPFSALGPMNYTQAAISNSGAYQVVAAANGGVYTSANSGSTWSQALTSPQPASAVNTVGGQVITPNLTGLAAATWTQNGVVWTASASTVANSGTYLAYYAFNNALTAPDWASSNSVYGYTIATPSFPSVNCAVTSNVIGLPSGSTVTGEWLQIQSSVPLVMNSYICSSGGGVVNAPRTYYIIGSNDGTNWYNIHFASINTNPYSTTFTSHSPAIIVNSTSAQSITAQIAAVATTTATSYSANAYTFFRISATSLFGTNASGGIFELGEWYINFATPATPLYVAPSTALIANQSLNAITVMPQQTGLASSTWTTNGVSWVASASTTASTNYPYNAFNSTTGSSAYYTGVFYNGNTGAYTGSLSTAISGLSAATGEWLQIQSSVPLIMSSYTFACTGWWQLAKTGFIVGSTDGTTWYPIQSFTMTTNPFTANYLTMSNYITIGPIGTQTQTIYGNQAGSGSFTSYTTSSNSYTYFRFIASTISGASTVANASNNEQFGPSEWFINFTAYTPALLQSLSLSPSGQYMALTGAGATTPTLTGLAANTWTANGVAWTASASSVLASLPLYAYGAFNNYVGLTGTYSWCCADSLYTGASGAYSGSKSTTILGGVGPITGEWLQIQSSVPLIMSSYTYASGGSPANNPRIYYIIGSNDGTTWYPIQNAVMTTNPSTGQAQSCTTYINVNQSGTQFIQGSQLGSGTFVAHPTTTNAYTYFRIIANTIYATSGNFELNEWYINFQSGPTFYSTDYGSSWTRSLTAATVPNANVLATSGNGQYSLQASGQTVFIANNTSGGNPTGNYTTPTFSPALSNPVSNAAVSASGQYMVVLIQSTSNNVYYSTNYGVSFTGVTLGSTAMVSCAVSADGSYITVANQTQVFTLNLNTQGLSITVGNQSGLINQGQNAVAIGNQAGVTNQSANSIVLNSSGTAVNAYIPGFFVAPVALAGSSVSGSFAVLGYGTDNQVVQSSSFFIGANGNVGVGTANPSTTLHVNGSITSGSITSGSITSGSITSSGPINGNGGVGSVGTLALYDAPTPANGFIRMTTASGTNYIQSGLTATTDSKADIVFGSIYAASEWMRIRSNGNVGIGVAQPTAPLHVVGVATSGLSGNPPMSLINSSQPSFRWDIGPNTNGDLVIFKNDAGAWLGRGNPGAGWNLQSDLRLKDEIEPMINCLDKINALRPVSYRWKSDMDSPYKSFGLIAQEAKDVIPEMVNALQNTTHGEIYGITYTTCIPILIGAVKELSSTVVELQAANAAISSQMAALLAWAQSQGYS